MATTQDTTATAADHQQAVDGPAPRRRTFQPHDRKTCQDHADCVRYQRRQASKAAWRAQGLAPKENAQYVQDQLVQPWRTAALRIANGGNVEDLALLDAALTEAKGQVVAAIAMMQRANPPQRDGSGASWRRIGQVLGLTPQGAQQKYGRRKRA